MTFVAKYDGRCAACSEVIEKGDALKWDDESGRAVHMDCDRSPDLARPAGPVCPVCFTTKAKNGACGCDD